MSKQRKKKEDRKAAQRAKASKRDNTRVAPATPVTTRSTRSFAADTSNAKKRALTFGRDTYLWMGIGFALVILGMLLMSGGRGDDPAVFDENVIYSFRRITLAPIVILSGLGTVIYAILKK
ncbi:MAG: DUF3098 domain-containing protein [Lewinella sp.]